MKFIACLRRISAERKQLFSDLSAVLKQARNAATYVVDKRNAAVTIAALLSATCIHPIGKNACSAGIYVG